MQVELHLWQGMYKMYRTAKNALLRVKSFSLPIDTIGMLNDIIM